MPITIRFDDQPLTVESPLTVEELLRERDLSPEILSVVLNGSSVPRSRYPETFLADGDELLAVVQVGGG